MTQVFPLFAIYWAFFWLVIIRVARQLDNTSVQKWMPVTLESFVKLVFKFFFWFYAYREVLGAMFLQTNYKPGDPEIYNLLNGRSNQLTDYSKFLKDHPESNFKGFPGGVESLYLQTKYDTPVTAWSHQPGKDKVTVLYTPFLLPQFAAKKYYSPFTSMQYEFPELSIRADMSRLKNPDARSILTLIAEIQAGAPLP